MGKHFCRVCGERLSRHNAYKNRKSGHGYIRICKECRKKQIMTTRSQRKHQNKLFTLKRKYTKIILEFFSALDRTRFIFYRRIQTIGARPKVGFSSRVGQRVEHIVKDINPETKETFHYYTETNCHECGGIIRFDDRGFKACVSCGLLDSNFTLSNEMGPDVGQRDLRESERYSSYARRGTSPNMEDAA